MSEREREREGGGGIERERGRERGGVERERERERCWLSVPVPLCRFSSAPCLHSYALLASVHGKRERRSPVRMITKDNYILVS